jgi:hypothetical protein
MRSRTKAKPVCKPILREQLVMGKGHQQNCIFQATHFSRDSRSVRRQRRQHYGDGASCRMSHAAYIKKLFSQDSPRKRADEKSKDAMNVKMIVYVPDCIMYSFETMA